MRRNLVLIGLIAGVMVAAQEARGGLKPGCEIQTCADGKVFCRALFDLSDTLGGATEPPEISCELEVTGMPCSEVPECGRRVPAVGISGLSLLGVSMAVAGVFAARRRRRSPSR